MKARWNSSDHDPEEFRLSLIGHLDELRSRLIKCLVSVILTWVVSWYLVQPINGTIEGIAKRSLDPVLKRMGSEYKPILSSFTDAFMIQFRLSFSLALIFCFPIIVYQIWAFIAPGLKPSEQQPFRRMAPVSVLLFFIGAGFSVAVLPSAFVWFAEQFVAFPGVGLFQQAGTLTYFCLKMILAFGIGFQLPLIVWALGALNLLSAETLIKYWRQAITVIFFAAAGITPSNDPLSMMMMAVPLCVLFGISVYAVKVTQRNKPKEAFMFDADQDDDKPALESSESTIVSSSVEETPVVNSDEGRS